MPPHCFCHSSQPPPPGRTETRLGFVTVPARCLCSLPSAYLRSQDPHCLLRPTGEGPTSQSPLCAHMQMDGQLLHPHWWPGLGMALAPPGAPWPDPGKLGVGARDDGEGHPPPWVWQGDRALTELGRRQERGRQMGGNVGPGQSREAGPAAPSLILVSTPVHQWPRAKQTRPPPHTVTAHHVQPSEVK